MVVIIQNIKFIEEINESMHVRKVKCWEGMKQLNAKTCFEAACNEQSILH